MFEKENDDSSFFYYSEMDLDEEAVEVEEEEELERRQPIQSQELPGHLSSDDAFSVVDLDDAAFLLREMPLSNESTISNNVVALSPLAKRQIWVLTIAMILYSIAFAITLPVFPHIILNLYDNDRGKAAEISGLLASMVAAMKFVSNPIWGAMSDSVGRKYLMVFSLACHSVSWCIVVLFPNTTSLFASKAIIGFTDMVAAITFTMIGDLTRAGEGSQITTKYFGLPGMALGIGLVIGPAIGGFLSKTSDAVPLLVASALSGLAAMLTAFFFKETLTSERRKAFDYKRATPIPSLKIFMSKRPLLLLLTPMFVLALAASIHNVWYLYTNYKYGWDEIQNGIFLSFIGFFIAISQGVFLPFLVPKIIVESQAIILGAFCLTVSLLGTGLADKGWQMFPVAVVHSLHGLADTSLKSIATEYGDIHEQGALQGAIASISTLGMMCGGPLFGFIFQESISKSLREQYPKECPIGHDDSVHNRTRSESNCGGLSGLAFYVDAGFALFALGAVVLIFQKYRATFNESQQKISMDTLDKTLEKRVSIQ